MRSFESLVQRQRNEWNRKVHSQYAMAYNTAYLRFKETASAVEAAEKAKAEFFATIVAVMSCSVGIAALGESWLSRLAFRTGLGTLGRRNTVAVANWIREGQQHAVIGFVFGKTLDQVKTVTSDKFKQIAASLVQQVTGGLTETDPLNRKIELDNILTAQADRLVDMAFAIEENRSLSVSQKAAATAALH